MGCGVTKIEGELASTIYFKEHRACRLQKPELQHFDLEMCFGVSECKGLMIVMFLRVFPTGRWGESPSTNQKFDHSSIPT